MAEEMGLYNYLNQLVVRLAPLQKNAALYFAALFVLIAIPAIFILKNDAAELTLTMGMLVALALFALATHLVKSYYRYQEKIASAGILQDTITAQKTQADDALSVSSIGNSSPSNNTIHLKSISSFWEQSEGDTVTIEGTLSRFAPFIIGPHKLKRDEHLKFRKEIEELEKKGITPGPSANAMLSFTAGQMVWNPNHPDAKWQYLGLYQSIVRNSIPIFVEKGYFSTVRSTLFDENKYGCDVRITGQVKRLSDISESIEGIFDKRHETVIRPEINLWKNQRPLGLYVDKNGSIEKTGPARYLDGDIWVAVTDGTNEEFRSRFLDLCDAEDMATKLHELKDEIKTLPKKYKITSVFDEKLWERI